MHVGNVDLVHCGGVDASGSQPLRHPPCGGPKHFGPTAVDHHQLVARIDQKAVDRRANGVTRDTAVFQQLFDHGLVAHQNGWVQVDKAI